LQNESLNEKNIGIIQKQVSEIAINQAKCHNMEINYKKLNPNGFQLLRFIQDVAIRFIIMFGGSSSGKSFSAAQIILIMTLLDGENTLVMRKVGASIEKTIYEDFKVAARLLHIDRLFKFQQNTIKCLLNGAKIDFSGLDNPEKIKGISNYKRILLEELSEFEEIDFKQLRKRLRGKKGQQIIATFNPIKETHWIKKKLFDVEKWHDVPMGVSIGGKDMPIELTTVKSIKMNEPKTILNPRTKEIEEQAPNMVIIQSTYLNNFWVVGSPCGTYGYYDEQCIADFEYDRQHDPDYYNVYALGEWGVIRTGSEFFGSFNRGKHSGEYKYNTSLPIHLSIDCNVLPYISVTYWQADLAINKILRQIDETCAESPNNTARKSAKLVAKRLNEMMYQDKIYLHGDVSTRASNTIDENNRSFLDLFISTLEKEGFDVVDCVGKKNPSVSMSGEFINAIFEEQLPGINISISENCNVSIEDYMSVQKDANGAILKTKVKNKTTLQTYEEHGHLSDTFRYVVCDILKDEFITFSNKRKRNLYARDGAIHFFNPDTECKYTNKVAYLSPNINGRFVLVKGCQCGDKWHITDVAYRETTSTDEIQKEISNYACSPTVIECADVYFPMVRQMREVANYEIRAMRESTDYDKRIAATSDYVKTSLLFNEKMLNDSAEYSQFMASLLDYNKDSDNKEASAVLSGFIAFVVKSFSA